MTRLFALHDAMFGQIESRLAWLSPTLARLVFAGVLLVYFWNSARTKLGDGPLGFLHPANGAYIQIFPKAAEAVGYDSSQLSTLQTLVVLGGQHYVEGRAVLGQDAPIAVEHGAPGRRDGDGADAVVLRELTVVLPPQHLQVPANQATHPVLDWQPRTALLSTHSRHRVLPCVRQQTVRYLHPARYSLQPAAR